jgi:hypothetical protein
VKLIPNWMLALALVAPAGAADIPMAGRKLAVKTEPASATRRLVFSSGRDSSIVIGSDPTVSGATLFVVGLDCDGSDCAAYGSSGPIHLPAASWVGLGNPSGSKGFRYKDRDATAGGVRKVILKPGKLVIKAKGPSWPWLPAGGEDGVALTLKSGSDRYCAEFGGTEKKNAAGHLVYKLADAPASCRVLCGNDQLESPEQCDGSDSTECSGLCQSDCTCPAPQCGNGVLESGEQCDGTEISQSCGADVNPGVGCDALCSCCIETGWWGCDVMPCCDPEPICFFSPGLDYCTLPDLGGLGDPCLLDALSCEEGLLCQPDPDAIHPQVGVCCGFDQCNADKECCFGGTCDSGQCCQGNGGFCAVSAEGPGVDCCAGQLCCDGGNCPAPASLPPGSTFSGACCGDVGTVCTAGFECCSGSCDVGASLCL